MHTSLQLTSDAGESYELKINLACEIFIKSFKKYFLNCQVNKAISTFKPPNLKKIDHCSMTNLFPVKFQISLPFLS